MSDSPPLSVLVQVTRMTEVRGIPGHPIAGLPAGTLQVGDDLSINFDSAAAASRFAQALDALVITLETGERQARDAAAAVEHRRPDGRPALVAVLDEAAEARRQADKRRHPSYAGGLR